MSIEVCDIVDLPLPHQLRQQSSTLPNVWVKNRLRTLSLSLVLTEIIQIIS